MDIAPQLMGMLITFIYLTITIVFWRKRFIKHLLLLVILLNLVKLTYNYFDNTFIVKCRPIFKLDSSSKNYNYEKDFINNIKNLSDVQTNNIIHETLARFNYPLIKLSLFGDDTQIKIIYPKYFMSEDQKILHIINQFIQELIPYVKFQYIHFSFKTSDGYFLYISIEIPSGEIPDKYFKVKNKFLQMFISLDHKYIVWNNWINEPHH